MELGNLPLVWNIEVSQELGGIVASENGGDINLLCNGH